MRYFRLSAALGTACHLLLFAFAIACGSLTSGLLDLAMAGGGVTGQFARLAAVLALGLPAVYLFRRALGGTLRRERQAFREELYRRVIRRRLDVDTAGELDVRLSNDLDAAAALWQEALPEAAEGLCTMAGSAVLLCRASVPLGLLLLAMSLLQLVPTVVYEKWAKAVYEQSHSAEENYDGRLIEGREGLGTLKAFGREAWFLKKLDAVTDGMVRAGVRAERTGTAETVVYELVDGILRYGSFLLMGVFILCGRLTVADTPVLIVLSGYLFGSLEKLLGAGQKLFEFKAARAHLEPVEPPRVQPGTGPLLSALNIRKSFDGRTVLDGVSVAVAPGERVLVAGPNGSGKSTLLKILLGLLPADGGEVRKANAKIAFASQEEAALTLTGRELMEDLACEGAADMERMWELLAGFSLGPGELRVPLSELSMGQRKKFYLAAAFAAPAELLVLDEPANHLDAPALRYLGRLIGEYGGAVLAVSHLDLAGVRWDKIVALRGDTDENHG